MTVNLCVNNSESNTVDKVLTGTIQFSGHLRDGTSVINPVVLVETSNPGNFNYMHIPEFGRYYFITGIDSVRTNLWAISGHVDVLTTYKNGIRGLGAIIARQENDYNLYLADDRLLVNTPRKMTSIAFPNRAAEGGSMVLTVAGG